MANQHSSTEFPPLTHERLVEKVCLMAQAAESWDQFDAQFLPFSAYYGTQSCAGCGVDLKELITAIGVSADQMREKNPPLNLAKVLSQHLMVARVMGKFEAALQRAASRGHEG